MITYQACHKIANQKHEHFWQQHCKQKHMTNIWPGNIAATWQEDIMADLISLQIHKDLHGQAPIEVYDKHYAAVSAVTNLATTRLYLVLRGV